jgi:hypothetical protein
MTRFDAARRAALMSDLLGILRGRPTDLLPFEEVREELHLRSFTDRGVMEVPLRQIAGSLGRERDFNRAFLPRNEALRDRWRAADEMAEGPEGFPAVELYQVGGVYFVVDGHHRVSVARATGAETIEARVKEFATPVPLTPATSIEEVILAGGRADFLAATGLTPDDPNEYRVTSPGGHERLLQHVNGHRYFLGIERGGPVSCDEAVRSWRDSVYRPMVALIRRSGILGEFPGRTETDLYLFTMDHLHHLRERYGAAAVRPEDAVSEVKRGRGLAAWLRRVLRRVRPPSGGGRG